MTAQDRKQLARHIGSQARLMGHTLNAKHPETGGARAALLTAAEWLESGFTPELAADWMDAGAFWADDAVAMDAVGIAPHQAAGRAPSGERIAYAVCNGDLTAMDAFAIVFGRE